MISSLSGCMQASPVTQLFVFGTLMFSAATFRDDLSSKLFGAVPCSHSEIYPGTDCPLHPSAIGPCTDTYTKLGHLQGNIPQYAYMSGNVCMGNNCQNGNLRIAYCQHGPPGRPIP